MLCLNNPDATFHNNSSQVRLARMVTFQKNQIQNLYTPASRPLATLTQDAKAQRKPWKEGF
jgi:hypothetical protein